MGWWRLSTDTLAESRFVVSALAETTACLLVLHKNAAAHPGERAWLDARLPAYRARLAGDPVTALLVRSALRPGWIADFVVPPSSGAADPPFHDELTAIREVPADQVHRHLEVALRGPVPVLLHRTDLAERLAGLLEWIWAEMVRPDWARRRRVIEADIVARTAQLGQAGWAAAFEAMRPGMRWLGEGRLQINRYDSPPRDLAGTRLLFVPVTPGVGWVSWNDRDRHAVIYPCSGVLAGPEPAPVSDALGAAAGAREGAGARPPGHAQDHDAAGRPDRPGTGFGGPPSEDSARRPARPAPARRTSRPLRPHRRRRGPHPRSGTPR
ncbi:transcriptional regulator [Actinoallomurus sp. WRP9H-5]|nr:transcriptional regulator [Actinoallomurus rhizosphaericola]MCO5997235.1 transcriptional regulator [Actinoallomurus rhizosphaericola]